MTFEEFERRLKALEDLEEIKKLHQKYMDMMDNLHYEEVPDLFTEDATVQIRNSEIKRGKKELAEIYMGILEKRSNVRDIDIAHIVIHPDITVDGDTAKGTWSVYMLFHEPDIQWVQGRNDCEYRKENGIWKISKLKFTRTLASDPSLHP